MGVLENMKISIISIWTFYARKSSKFIFDDYWLILTCILHFNIFFCFAGILLSPALFHFYSNGSWPWVSFCIQAFLDGEHIKLLMKDARNELLHGVTEKITTRYYELAADTVNVVSCQDLYPFGYFVFSSLQISKSCLIGLHDRQGKQSLLYWGYAKVHNDELEQLLIPWIIIFLTQRRSACSYFLMFRWQNMCLVTSSNIN